MRLTRRNLLAATSLIPFADPVLAIVPAAAMASATGRPSRVQAVAMRYVRLKPSPFADAFAANRRYVLSLNPERLLHNFYVSAGLPAAKPVYGGWEAMGIAGHMLGHWLSACALIVANTGDRQAVAGLDHALAEMARIQAKHGDGYCAGTTVERNGKMVDGKVVFEEVRRGDIRSAGFDLNGGWVPLYTWHKVFAGLLDAHVLAGNPRAMPITLGMAGYLAGVLEPLTDDQMQRVLAAEHGGLNESYAELHALTGDPRWLRMARKIRHKAVLDPLTVQVDKLSGLHANTQIPKVIGLARLHELTGEPGDAAAARFFHDCVTRHHSYVIGGNSEREHFGPPDLLSSRITEATCEACNSYNMMRLTRHLYSWAPHARWFDYYERVQLNHILAHQRPDTGAFVYFMPLAAGARRNYSDPEDSFWCCVGSGIESHAKHADSIFWHDPKTLFVNLYIPSRLDWPERGLTLDLDTALPADGEVTLDVRSATAARQAIALRIPGWTREPAIVLNGRPAPVTMRDGYAVIDRRWSAGDSVRLTLPMTLEATSTPDDPSMVAFTRGPLVLAADLGPAAKRFDGIGPALVVAGAPTAQFVTDGAPDRFRAIGALGEEVRLRPFYNQYDRRTAVYFPTFTPAVWATARDGYVRAAQERRSLARRTTDTLFLGEMQPERDHGFVPGKSGVVTFGGRSARQLRGNDVVQFLLTRRPGAAILRVLIGPDDDWRAIRATVDDAKLGAPTRSDRPEGAMAVLDFTVPAASEQGRSRAAVGLSVVGGSAMIYEARMLSVADGPAAADS